jgi:glycosyltransferase involved in cell wall biosynthesis
MSRPIHILTLSTLFPNANQPNFGIFVERQTAALAQRPGVKVTVVNPVAKPIWPISLFAAAQPDLPAHEHWRGLDVHRPLFANIPRFGGRWNPSAIARAVLPLVKDLHARDPFDLIDAEFFYPDGPAAMRIAHSLNLPFSIKARGADIHHWGHQSGCGEQLLHAAEAASGLLAVSAALKNDMVALGIAENKIRVHYTGLDQQKFTPVDRHLVKAELGVSGPLIISTGALIPRKNQALVIAALAEIPDATLLLAGSGPEEASYRKLTQSLGVTERVRFLGNVDHNALPRLTAAADVAVLVSSSEGLANAWVEALACGTPIVISEAGGARELVTSRIAGRVVRQDAASVANAIREILNDPPPQQDVRACVSGFSWQNNAMQLEDYFREIVS